MIIKSRTPSFRRAGVSISAEGTYVDVSYFTLAQLKALRDEPNLVCPSDLDKLISDIEASYLDKLISDVEAKADAKAKK